MLARREIPELPPKTQDGIRKACRNFTSHFFSALSSVRDSLTDDSRGEETVRYDGTDTEQSFHSWSSRVDNWDDPEARLPYPIHDIIDPIDPVDPTNSIATELVDPRRRNLSPPVKPPLPARRTPLYDDSPDWIRYDSLEIANSQHVHCPPGLARSRPTSAIMADSQQPPDSVATPAQSAAALGVSALKCCCGSVECAFLRHNNAILDSVERDVHQAARMGQVRLPNSFQPPLLSRVSLSSLPSVLSCFLHERVTLYILFIGLFTGKMNRWRGLKVSAFHFCSALA